MENAPHSATFPHKAMIGSVCFGEHAVLEVFTGERLLPINTMHLRGSDLPCL